jgi:putative ABC transport system ATP-binding protein
MIELQDIKKVFNQGKPNEFWAIRGISLQFEPNKVTCLKGSSGSGKTTLLAMIGCLSRPTAGRIMLDGQLLSGLPERFLTDIRRHTFGFVFQRFNLIQGMTVQENIMLPAYPLGPKHAELVQRAKRLMDHFKLHDKAENRVEWLSGGESQRVAICRALINDPSVLIADEPTANLDSKLSKEFMALIGELCRSGKTVLISSHDPVVFESPVIDRVVELQDGLLMDRDD